MTAEAFGNGNQIVATMENDVLTIDVTSASGIGHGTITTQSRQVPRTITLRLHLDGLEQLILTAGTTIVTAQVSSSDNTITQTAATETTSPRTTTAEDPHWLTIQRSAIGESLFSIDVPVTLLPLGNGPLAIEWIDFYR